MSFSSSIISPSSGESDTHLQSRLMLASISSYFQPAVSGLLMKSFTANGIQTAERQRNRERERGIPAASICISSALVNGDRNSILGRTLGARSWCFPGFLSGICSPVPREETRRVLGFSARVCWRVHVLTTRKSLNATGQAVITGIR